MGVGLYAHQREALSKMRSGSVLCGGVGSGKSRTALAYFISKVCGGHLPLPGSSSGFDIKEPVPLYIITTARKRDSGEWEQECATFLISYDESSLVPLCIDSWNNIGKYVDVSDAFFIFDEQRIVGTGKWATTFVKIAKRNKWVLLSATPGDTWFDYWAVFTANGYYKNVTDFRRQHVVYRYMAKFPQIERYVGTKKLERIRNEVLVPMSFERRTSRHHHWIKVGYDCDSYSIVMKKRWNVYEDQPLKNISETCYTLRKVVNSDSRRTEALIHILESHPKAIVFYNFDYELEMLRDCLSSNGFVFSEWNGHRHQDIPEGPRWAYLVQYTAGCEGWNCVSTDTVIFFSQNYSYKTMEQASGRIDRINTPYTDLHYFHIFSDSPIDSAIRACVSRKRTFNESAFLYKKSRDKISPFNERGVE